MSKEMELLKKGFKPIQRFDDIKIYANDRKRVLYNTRKDEVVDKYILGVSL